MKFCLIGPGIDEIPPRGHGAVESLIWEYAGALISLGHSVDIINSPDINEIIRSENSKEYDLTHLHYDVFHQILPYLKGKRILVSSHYPYIEQLQRHKHDSYYDTFKFMVENSHKFNIAAVSRKDMETFIANGVDPKDIFLILNGVNTKKFTCNISINSFSFSAICLGKIEPRKRQHLTHDIKSVYYIGRGPFEHKNYLGEISQEQKETTLTNFGAMVLLSDGENGTPLAIKEGMAAGLSIVISEFAASEIKDQPFVDVISENMIHDKDYIENRIKLSTFLNIGLRQNIRQYCENHWSWNKLIGEYVKNASKHD